MADKRRKSRHSNYYIYLRKLLCNGLGYKIFVCRSITLFLTFDSTSEFMSIVFNHEKWLSTGNRQNISKIVFKKIFLITCFRCVTGQKFVDGFFWPHNLVRLVCTPLV